MDLAYIQSVSPVNAYSTQQLAEASQNGARTFWGHKTHLYKFRKIEIISHILSDHNAITLKTDHKGISKKHKSHGD